MEPIAITQDMLELKINKNVVFTFRSNHTTRPTDGHPLTESTLFRNNIKISHSVGYFADHHDTPFFHCQHTAIYSALSFEAANYSQRSEGVYSELRALEEALFKYYELKDPVRIITKVSVPWPL